MLELKKEGLVGIVKLQGQPGLLGPWNGGAGDPRCGEESAEQAHDPGEQISASSGICLCQSHGITPRREKAPKKVG